MQLFKKLTKMLAMGSLIYNLIKNYTNHDLRPISKSNKSTIMNIAVKTASIFNTNFLVSLSNLNNDIKAINSYYLNT